MKTILREGNVVFKQIRVDVITDVWSYFALITKYFNTALQVTVWFELYDHKLTEHTLYIMHWISCLMFLSWRYSFI